MADVADIRARLEAISEELADMALDILREAVDQGAEKRPDLEKRVTRARAAVDKAANLLHD
jgi:hypothetical protein